MIRNGVECVTYQAFYRAYRPQSFVEMSGQKHIKQTLQNALDSGKTTHAYLFSGPRGTGKTSTAKIFAKALNCENGPAKEPCNTCAICTSITDGSNPDVLEFDAASHSRVEEMRDVIEKVRFAPSNARYKVYIIDEVHMLSTSAFNALLKTLEEPPPHAVFVLATTEPHKIPLTIISRCQRFDFKRISNNDIVERMTQVLDDAGIPYDEKVLRLLAQASAGGMRDALSLLDQVVSYSTGTMTMEEALFITGSIGSDAFVTIAEALLAGDVNTALATLDQLIMDGKDPVRLIEDLVTFFRDLLIMQHVEAPEDMVELAEPTEDVIALAKRYSQQRLYASIQIATEMQQEMRFSNHPKIYVETALIRLSQLSDQPAATGTSSVSDEQVQKLENKIAKLEAQLKSGGGTAPAEAPKQKRQRGPSGIKVPAGRIQEVLKSATKPAIQQVKTQWAQILQQLQRSHAALLNDAEPVAASDTAFVLKFKYEIHCQMAMDNQTFSTSFPQVVEDVTGTLYEVLYTPEDQWLEIRSSFIAGNQLAGGMEEPEAGEDVDVQEDPLISEATKLFGEDFVEIKED